MKDIANNKITQKLHLILLVSALALFVFAGVARAMSEVEEVVVELQQIVDENPGTDLADEAEDALYRAQSALDELAKTPPDCQAAVGDMERAVGNIEAAVTDGLLNGEQGTDLMNLLTCAAWQIAVGAICQGISCEADPGKIAGAEQALTEGEQLWIDEAYEDAVDSYKDALAEAEDALSGTVDPLAGLVTKTLVHDDGHQVVGYALLCYDENANVTFIRLKCWALEPETYYFVVLVGPADDECNCSGILIWGSYFSTNFDGKACLLAWADGFAAGPSVAFVRPTYVTPSCSFSRFPPFDASIWSLPPGTQIVPNPTAL